MLRSRINQRQEITKEQSNSFIEERKLLKDRHNLNKTHRNQDLETIQKHRKDHDWGKNPTVNDK